MTNPVVAFVALAVLVAVVPARAQTPSTKEAAILAVIDRFMHAVTTGDDAAMASLRLPGTTTTVERPDPAGGTTLVRRPFPAPPIATSPPSAAPASVPSGSVRERYWDPVVHVRGRLAMVWTPYEFWRDGKTSHCGVDVFELVEQDSVWKIGNVMYTVEPDACPAMRPKDSRRIRPAP